MFISALLATSALAFDAGADLRIRQEFMDNVPGVPYGVLHTPVESIYRYHMRYRPRVWGEVKGDAGEAGRWRLFTRLTDEFRWNARPKNHTTSWPGEVVVDNLLLEGMGIFDGFMDVQLGRRDLYGYCGLEHVFVDGTPGDGSRTQYADMANVRFNFEDESTLDFFGLYNFDSADDFRWGDDDHRFSSLTARAPNGRGNQDDWGSGVIWGSKLMDNLRYQVFAVEKGMRHQEKSHTELLGARLLPQFSETLSGKFEGMSQLNGEWSGFAEVGWKSSRQGLKPILKLGYHYMSGEWNPMWARDAIESDIFLYGTHNGVAWWSNQHYLKASAGVEFSPGHTFIASTGPIFAADRDGAGGSDGGFKGLYTRGKYSFPILRADRGKGERFEIFAHVIGEYFCPGDYYESSHPAWFARWQLDFRF